MKRVNLLKTVVASSIVLIVPVVASAHPGHDGHELTWEFANGHFHLDWLIGAGLVTAALIGVYRLAKRSQKS
jgi:hypothetical protein